MSAWQTIATNRFSMFYELYFNVLRNELQKLKPLGFDRCAVAHLLHMPMASASKHSCGGLIGRSLNTKLT